jgi:hypothetical protein
MEYVKQTPYWSLGFEYEIPETLRRGRVDAPPLTRDTPVTLWRSPVTR